MHNFAVLIKGEMTRLMKYKILQISFAVTILWLITIFVIGKEHASTFVPMFIFMDAALMSVLLVGASLFYEKQENTLKTLLITPSGFKAIILSKVISAIYLSLQSTIMISLFSYFLFDVSIRFIPLYAFVMLITVAHTALGYTFAIFAKDFNGLIAFVGLYMIVFAMPSIFYALGVFPQAVEALLLVSPTHASLLMIDFSFNKPIETWMLLLGIAYLVVMATLLLIFVVSPKYAQTAVRE